MNVANHQEKEKNEKTGKRKAGVERRQANLKRVRATLLRSFRGLHGEKMVCVRGVPGVTGPSGRPTAILNQSKRVGDRTTTLRRLLIVQFNFARFTCTYYIYDRNFALHYPKRSESIRVLRTDRKSVMMIRVKVNLKS